MNVKKIPTSALFAYFKHFSIGKNKTNFTQINSRHKNMHLKILRQMFQHIQLLTYSMNY